MDLLSVDYGTGMLIPQLNLVEDPVTWYFRWKSTDGKNHSKALK